ncbi:MAG: methyltransferase [Elusimicrobiota bacterium]
METLEKPKAEPSLSPEHLLQIGMGFWASKVLLAAVKLDLFSVLGPVSMKAEKIQDRLGLHPRGTRDFLDTLVALNILERKDGAYANTRESAFFLDGNSPAYLGDMLLNANDRLWEFWGRFEEALRTGLPQNETREGGGWILDVIYAQPTKRDVFLKAMIGLSAGSSMAVARSFDFRAVKRFCDLGGGPGTLCATVQRAHPHVECVNLDLPPVEPVFREYIARQGLAQKVRFHAGDCLKDALPPADVYAMGHLLHGISPDNRVRALSRAFGALPSGGHLLVIEALIDDERRTSAFGLLMSLDMMIETPEGRNFSAAELRTWMGDVGFEHIRHVSLGGPYSMMIGRKS